jgi:lipopolysaccharide/colanic/teichoic acid biosynthesis glycosyltransferase
VIGRRDAVLAGDEVRPPPGSLAERSMRLAAERFGDRRGDRVIRLLDVVLGGALMLVLAPVAGAIAAALRIAAGPPVLYRGLRVGRHGRVFVMRKFRTLRPDAEARIGPYSDFELSRRTEHELAPLGRFLRASQLDELPQLVNVVRGDMSLVGPRPIRPVFFEQLCGEIPQYWQRLVVRPGMTGFAQVRMSRDMTWQEKLAHDLEYVADRSVGLYLRLIAATASRIIVQTLRAGR